jgi:prevent-host-death family protein
MRMGLREANQHFAKAIRAVKAGQEVVLTDRGKPVAVIRPYIADGGGVEAAVRRLEAAGLLIAARVRKPMRPGRLWRIRGRPLTATLFEDRNYR